MLKPASLVGQERVAWMGDGWGRGVYRICTEAVAFLPVVSRLRGTGRDGCRPQFRALLLTPKQEMS